MSRLIYYTINIIAQIIALHKIKYLTNSMLIAVSYCTDVVANIILLIKRVNTKLLSIFTKPNFEIRTLNTIISKQLIAIKNFNNIG